MEEIYNSRNYYKLLNAESSEPVRVSTIVEIIISYSTKSV